MTIIYENGSGGFGTLDGLTVGDSLSARVGSPPLGAAGFPGDPSDEVLLNLEPGATYTFTLNWSGTANFIGLTFVDGANPEDILLTGGVEQATEIDGNGNRISLPTPPSTGPAAQSDPVVLTFTVPESGQVHVTIVGSGYQWETSAPNSTKGINYNLALTEIIPPEHITEPNMSIADLRITEVHYNPEDGTPPFLEITNTGTTPVASGDFFVGNSDFFPQYYQVIGPNAILAPTIPAGATLVLVPSVPDTTGEVFVPPVPISQAEFEAIYGALPEGAVYYNYPAFFVGADPNPYDSNVTYTIAGNDIFGDSVFIPTGAALGESAQVDGDGNVTFGAPTPGSTAMAPPPTGPTEGDDTLMGTDGADVIDGLGGRDTIDGGAGDDDLTGGDGNDAINGGQDNDTITLNDGNDNAWGGEGDDDLFGGTGLDRLNGNSGDDDIFGGKGGDIIQGGSGEDYIEGGAQSDIISGGTEADEIYGGNGNDSINGDAGADIIFGGSGGDDIHGGSFDDIIYGDHGYDKIRGGAGDDLIYGGITTDRLIGNSGDDEIYGGRGNDNLKGSAGDDLLFGGAQGDRLDGGTGEDELHGGLGDDRLTGGADADVFVFEGTVNSDIILDFEVGLDKIDLSAYGPVSEEDAIAAASQVGNNVVIDLKGNGDITLRDIALEDLSLDDFIYIPDDIFIAV